MSRADLVGAGEVGDGAGELEDTVEGAGGALQALGGDATVCMRRDHALAMVCGAGMGRPQARLASIQLSIASCPCFTASS